MQKILVSKQQAKAIGQVIYPDVKQYCLDHFERYFAWYIDDVRKSKGKPPLKTIHACKGRVS